MADFLLEATKVAAAIDTSHIVVPTREGYKQAGDGVSYWIGWPDNCSRLSRLMIDDGWSEEPRTVEEFLHDFNNLGSAEIDETEMAVHCLQIALAVRLFAHHQGGSHAA